MSKKAATAAEKRHMDKVAALGCIACKVIGHDDTPAEIHHLDRARIHTRVLPLCAYHHRHGPAGQAVHNCTPEWEHNFGTQEDLLLQVNEQLC
jgi:hypothetical protein